jgi:hypothetical protein
MAMRNKTSFHTAAALALWLVADLSLAEEKASAPSLEPVRGIGCYSFGDNETPAQAKKAAMALAQEQAVKSHRVFVQSASTVKNMQLEEDLIQSASAGMLHEIQVEKQTRKDQEICITIIAKLSPAKMEELIQQRLNAKDLAQAAQDSMLTAGSAFGLRVWTNKQEPYVEGDSLVISVQADRDAFLKLDYYQADGTVVHLVPNLYGGEAFIRAGRVYTFGANGAESFTIKSPFGPETIKAIASTQPFGKSLVSKRSTENAAEYLTELKSGLRGVQIAAGIQTGGAEGGNQWAEASVGLTTMSRSVVNHIATRSPRTR